VITNTANQIRWRWDTSPFGELAANENPSGLGAFKFNLRFPGQYLDKETNLFYNYFRDYDPQTGRYVQSDPIGLRGGLNTYLYVHGKPTALVDPTGRIGVDTIVKQVLKWLLRKVASEAGQEPIERGARRERDLLIEQALHEFEQCLTRCETLPADCQGPCEDDCVRRYKNRLQDIDTDFPNVQ